MELDENALSAEIRRVSQIYLENNKREALGQPLIDPYKNIADIFEV